MREGDVIDIWFGIGSGEVPEGDLRGGGYIRLSGARTEKSFGGKVRYRKVFDL